MRDSEYLETLSVRDFYAEVMPTDDCPEWKKHISDAKDICFFEICGYGWGNGSKACVAMQLDDLDAWLNSRYGQMEERLVLPQKVIDRLAVEYPIVKEWKDNLACMDRYALHIHAVDELHAHYLSGGRALKLTPDQLRWLGVGVNSFFFSAKAPGSIKLKYL